jgi:hypothetical protein
MYVRMGNERDECGISVGTSWEDVRTLVHVSVELHGTLTTWDASMWAGVFWVRVETIDRQLRTRHLGCISFSCFHV